eukprot:2757670-Alexandrium_andersonii.AAC.1
MPGLRQLCSHGLDFCLCQNFRVSPSEPIAFFSKEELLSHARRRLAAVPARQEVAATVGQSCLEWCAREEAHLFWHGLEGTWPSGGEEFAACAPVHLPDTFRLGLESLVAVSGLSV